MDLDGVRREHGYFFVWWMDGCMRGWMCWKERGVDGRMEERRGRVFSYLSTYLVMRSIFWTPGSCVYLYVHLPLCLFSPPCFTNVHGLIDRLSEWDSYSYSYSMNMNMDMDMDMNMHVNVDVFRKTKKRREDWRGEERWTKKRRSQPGRKKKWKEKKKKNEGKHIKFKSFWWVDVEVLYIILYCPEDNAPLIMVSIA